MVAESMDTLQPSGGWENKLYPGQLSHKKDSMIQSWNDTYGEGNWRLIWQLSSGETMQFDDMFWGVYVASYVQYFHDHPDEADLITSKYSYAYDRDMVTKEQAFDPDYLRNTPGSPSQFHHVALNIALERILQKPFTGETPLQVRYGRKNMPDEKRPEGWKWSPGLIPAIDQELIPDNNIHGWWKPGSIEDLYQQSKVLQVKKNIGITNQSE